jgi:hypothetical protein
MLFGRQHEHRKTERRGDEHLDEHALSEVDIRGGNWAKWMSIKKKVVPTSSLWREYSDEKSWACNRRNARTCTESNQE